MIDSDFYLTEKELEKIKEILSCVNDLTLTMISTCTISLPDNSTEYNKTKDSKVQYQKVMETKNLILSCLPLEKRDFYSKIIEDVQIGMDGKLKILCNQNFKSNCDKKIEESINFIEKEINIQNENYNQRLTNALDKARILIKQVKEKGIKEDIKRMLQKKLKRQ